MKEIVFVFNYGGVEYVVYKDGEKLIPCKHVNHALDYDFTTEEKKIVEDVLKKMKISDNNIKLANIKFNNKEYQHFFDKENEWNIFLNVDGTEVSKDELRSLNSAFNYQDDVMYSENTNKDDKNFIKRIVKIGKKTVVVLFASTMLISSPIGKAYQTPDALTYIGKTIEAEASAHGEKEEKEEKIVEVEKDDIDAILDAILNNENLTDEDKENLSDIIPILEENKEYIDASMVASRFANLKVAHIDYDLPTPVGTYCDGMIDIYHNPGDDKTLVRNVELEEAMHATQGAYTYQGIFEPYAKYLVNKNNVSNDYSKVYIRMLIDLIGEKPLKEFFFQGKIEGIKKALYDIIPVESKQYDILCSLNGVYRLESEAKQFFDLDTEMNLYNTAHLFEQAYKEYYEKAKGKSMYEGQFSRLSILHPNIKSMKGEEASLISGSIENDFQSKIEDTITMPEAGTRDIYTTTYTVGKEKHTIKVYGYLLQDLNTLKAVPSYAVKIDGSLPIKITYELAEELASIIETDDLEFVQISVNGDYVSFINVDTRLILTINKLTGKKATRNELLNYLNMPFDEYKEVVDSEVEGYKRANGIDYPINYSVKGDNYGIDREGNIITYLTRRLDDIDMEDDFAVSRVNPKDIEAKNAFYSFPKGR